MGAVPRHGSARRSAHRSAIPRRMHGRYLTWPLGQDACGRKEQDGDKRTAVQGAIFSVPWGGLEVRNKRPVDARQTAGADIPATGRRCNPFPLSEQ